MNVKQFPVRRQKGTGDWFRPGPDDGDKLVKKIAALNQRRRVGKITMTQLSRLMSDLFKKYA